MSARFTPLDRAALAGCVPAGAAELCASFGVADDVALGMVFPVAVEGYPLSRRPMLRLSDRYTIELLFRDNETRDELVALAESGGRYAGTIVSIEKKVRARGGEPEPVVAVELVALRP